MIHNPIPLDVRCDTKSGHLGFIYMYTLNCPVWVTQGYDYVVCLFIIYIFVT